MNSNKIFKIAVVLGSAILFFLLWAYIQGTHKKVKGSLFALQTKYTNTRLQLLEAKETLYYTVVSERNNISDDLHKVLPKDICILRLHDVACMGCYAENITKFSQKMKENNSPFFVLSSYHNKKQLFADLSGIITLDSTNYLNINQYGILPADSINRPYLFIRNGNNTIQDVYIFEKGEYELLDKYINTLK